MDLLKLTLDILSVETFECSKTQLIGTTESLWSQEQVGNMLSYLMEVKLRFTTVQSNECRSTTPFGTGIQ